VLIIGLFDLLSTIKVSLNDPAWTGFGVERISSPPWSTRLLLRDVALQPFAESPGLGGAASLPVGAPADLAGDPFHELRARSATVDYRDLPVVVVEDFEL